jgi:hypothetical protein
MRKKVAAWPERTWAVEGSNGAGRPLAQRLLADGERVVDVPAKLSARARLFDTGHPITARPTPMMRTRSRWSRTRARQLTAPPIWGAFPRTDAVLKSGVDGLTTYPGPQVAG